MRKIVLGLLLFLLAWPALAQLPPAAGFVVDSTPVQGGSTGQCFYKKSDGRLGAQACSTGSVSTWSGGTTGMTPSSATSGAVTMAGVLVGANGGTGVANTGKTITLGGNLTTSGAFASTFTMTNTTAVTFPTSGTLATTADLASYAPLDAPAFTTSAGLSSAANTAFSLTNTGGGIAWFLISTTGGDYSIFKGGGADAVLIRGATYETKFNGAIAIGGASPTLTSGAFGLPKISASGSAPGAGTGKLELVAGTNPGTCKLVLYAGTSATSTTIIDNVGTGC